MRTQFDPIARKAARSRRFKTIVFALIIGGITNLHAADITVMCQKVAAKACTIEGQFEVNASSRTAWDVLTDYNHLSRFVPDMQTSTIKERRPDGVVVGQWAMGRFFLFSRMVHVILDVREQPFSGLVFHDTLLKDFQAYEGSWTLEQQKDSLKITYRLKVAPVLDVPNLVTQSVLRRNARSLLNDVRKEIMRRQKAEGEKP